MLDGVLKLKLHRGVELVGFADDIVITDTGKMLEEVEMMASEAIEIIGNWIKSVKLQIAHHKTVALLVSNRKAAQRKSPSENICLLFSNHLTQ